LAIASEYTKRYHKIHKSQGVIEWCDKFGGKPTDIGLTDFPQKMPDIYRNVDPIVAYRTYYKHDKAYMAHWTLPANQPYWWDTKI
jgi:hypothetical protein